MADLTDIKGVSDSRADDLRDADFITVNDVATTTEDELAEVSGIGQSTAADLIDSAQDVVRADTLGEDDAEDEAEEETEEFEDSVPDVTEDNDEYTEEDIEDLLEETEEMDGGGDDESPASDEEEDEEAVEDDGPDEYEFTLAIEDDEMYDFFYHAVVSMRVGEIRANYQQEVVAEEILDQLRDFDGAGSITLSLTRDELNSLHAVLAQAQSSYKAYGTEAFNAIQSTREQVQRVREAFL